jgi:negative regulator of replication initiation
MKRTILAILFLAAIVSKDMEVWFVLFLIVCIVHWAIKKLLSFIPRSAPSQSKTEQVWEEAEKCGAREMEQAIQKYNATVDMAQTSKTTKSRRRGASPMHLYDEAAFAQAVEGYENDTRRLFAKQRGKLLRLQRRSNV